MTPDEEGFFRTISRSSRRRYPTPVLRRLAGRAEQGRADRAEFIRVQCELARLSERHPRTELLRRREQQLEPPELERSRWIAARDADYGFTLEFRRGFILRLHVRNQPGLEDLLRQARRVFQYGPIRHLDIQGNYGRHVKEDEHVWMDTAAVQALVALPEIRWGRRLTLEWITDEAALALARSPVLDLVQRIRINWSVLDYWNTEPLLRRRFGDRLELRHVWLRVETCPDLDTSPPIP
jgi:hypothetical protein